jgi:hypothetical protein
MRRASRTLARLGALLTLPAVLASPAFAQPAPGAPVVIDGPSSAIVGLSGLSVARDGTGGVVYLKDVGGVPHVFVSRLLGGSFQPPQQVDSALAGASTQAVIAAGRGGLLLVGFINAGQLYMLRAPDSSTPSSAPALLFGAASNPSLAITNFGKAYLAFTAADGSGFDVRTAYYYKGVWALESAPLNNVPADDAGTGNGRPQVAAAGDGVAIVVWGEGGHVFSRRVWGTAPSIVLEQADAPLPGCNETSADEPVVSAGADSSYADVAFHEVLSCNSHAQQRVLMNRLHGSMYDGVTQPDGLSTSSTEGADQPQIVMGEYGRGFVTSARDRSNSLIATHLDSNGASGALFGVNDSGAAQASPPYGVPATAGVFSQLIAWQQDPGTAGIPEIRARYSDAGAVLGSDMVLSAAALGPTNAASGLAASGDFDGDAAVTWMQGAPGAGQIVADLLYKPPGRFAALHSFSYARSAEPRLGFSTAHESWAPVSYLVAVDGSGVGQTTATSFVVPTPLTNGPHSWQVTATNGGGLRTAAAPAAVFVDTVPPTAGVTVSGKRLVHAPVHIYAAYRDLPPSGEPAGDAAGIAKVTLNCGDGTVLALALGVHRRVHSYRRVGRYRIVLAAVDAAGNKTTTITYIKVSAPPGPQRRGHGRPKGK